MSWRLEHDGSCPTSRTWPGLSKKLGRCEGRARLAPSRVILGVSQTYFQKGFGLKAAVGPGPRAELPQPGGGPPEGARVPRPRGRRRLEARPGVRLLLRGRSRGRVRLRDAGEVPRPADLPLRRDHPQPRRERAHRRTWASASCPRRRTRPALRGGRGGGRGHPARVRRDGGGDGAPARPGLRARRHHLRQRAERVEERAPVRARRVHRRHPRQALPRGDEGHGLAGPDPRGRPLPLRARPRGGGASCAGSSAGTVRAPKRSASASGPRRAPASTPSGTSRASASPTRRPCS